MIKRSDHNVFQFVLRRSCRGCGLGELASSCCEEFLRELIVGVAASSDLAGSILVEILHSGEGEDVEQVDQTSKQFSRVCDCFSLPLSLTYVYILHAVLLNPHMLDILVLS